VAIRVAASRREDDPGKRTQNMRRVLVSAEHEVLSPEASRSIRRTAERRMRVCQSPG